VKILCGHEEFIRYVSGALSEKTVYIPDGFNVAHEDAGVNDQVAWGDYETMRLYCSMIFSIDWSSPVSPSENQLFKHLAKSEIKVVRPTLNYKLVLSKCFTIAICGDSGAGKTTVSELIHEILPYDETLLFETDRYHKWERGDERYKTTTHLNPAANHIEKLSSDTFKLCIGDDIHAVDYDHSTGKFTEPQNIKPSKFMLFCGLHTLYKESLNDIYNLKIFIDTDPELKKQWKVDRDVCKRGADMEKVIQSMKSREPDYETYIKPQKRTADVILYFKSRDGTVVFEASVHKLISQRIASKLLPVLTENPCEDPENMVLYKFKERETADALNKYMQMFGCTLHIPHDDFKGLLQYIIISLLWK
jgi:uridine kinase